MDLRGLVKVDRVTMIVIAIIIILILVVYFFRDEIMKVIFKKEIREVIR